MGPGVDAQQLADSIPSREPAQHHRGLAPPGAELHQIAWRTVPGDVGQGGYLLFAAHAGHQAGQAQQTVALGVAQGRPRRGRRGQARGLALHGGGPPEQGAVGGEVLGIGLAVLEGHPQHGVGRDLLQVSPDHRVRAVDRVDPEPRPQVLQRRLEVRRVIARQERPLGVVHARRIADLRGGADDVQTLSGRLGETLQRGGHAARVDQQHSTRSAPDNRAPGRVARSPRPALSTCNAMAGATESMFTAGLPASG